MSSSMHHSFDVANATEFGIEEAILIHHFQHWIRVNRKLKRNLHEGKTWSYQTYGEITAHMPYLSYDQVRRSIETLVKRGVIVKGNFNKRKGDQTVWFAFADEKKFVPDFPDKNGPLPEEMANSPGVWQNCQGGGENARALPDPKPDPKPSLAKARENACAHATPPERTTYGKFVKLSKEEFDELRDFCGGTNVLSTIIAQMNDYLSSTGKKAYKDFAATIRNWHRRDSTKGHSWKPKNTSDDYRATSSDRSMPEPVLVPLSSIMDTRDCFSPG